MNTRSRAELAAIIASGQSVVLPGTGRVISRLADLPSEQSLADDTYAATLVSAVAVRGIVRVTASADMTIGARKWMVDTTTGDVVLRLPALADCAGLDFIIKKISSDVHKVTIAPRIGEGFESAADAARAVLNYDGDAVEIQNNVTYWVVT